jgi:hypothetical protein
MKKVISRGRLSVLAVVVAMSMGRIASAHVVVQTPPSHFTVGNQEFDATVGGLRAYLDATKTRDPALYFQLAPDVERLETKRTEAIVAGAIGIAAATASVVYAFKGQSTCTSPANTDPTFAADAAAWAACNDRNMHHVETFTLLGMGTFVAGLAAAWAVAPSRADLLAVVNKNNQLSPEPLRLQLGYDPTSRLTYGGVTLNF